MNNYIKPIVVFIVIYLIVSAMINYLIDKDEDKIKIKKTRNHGGFGNRSVRYSSNVKNQLTKMLSENANAKKKFSTETMCVQAGFDLSYGEYKLICITVAFVIPILIIATMRNIYLAVIFAFIGYNIPRQFIKYKANRRILKMDKQVGSLLRMIIERYKANKNISKSLIQSVDDFRGLEPIHSILLNAVSGLEMGKTTETVLEEMARQCGNKYMKKFSDYYKMIDDIDEMDLKVSLLSQAYKQYEENEKIKNILRDKISGPVKEAYIMVIATPVFMLYQCIFSDGYIQFMINTKFGQVGLTIILCVILACIWFINAKIGAPIDSE